MLSDLGLCPEFCDEQDVDVDVIRHQPGGVTVVVSCAHHSVCRKIEDGGYVEAAIGEVGRDGREAR